MTAACLCSKRREEDGGLLDGAVKGGRRKVLGVRSQRREEGAVVKGARRRRREGRRSDVNVKEHDDGDVQDGGVLRVGEGRGALVRPWTFANYDGLSQSSRRERCGDYDTIAHLPQQSARRELCVSKKSDFSLL